jgi:hypothetical protein
MPAGRRLISPRVRTESTRFEWHDTRTGSPAWNAEVMIGDRRVAHVARSRGAQLDGDAQGLADARLPCR